MSINDIFNAAAAGVNMQRLGIEVTGQNIANVNTAGYSRQRVILETGPVRDLAGYSLGTGVKLAAIQRSYDELLQKQLTDANSSYNQNLVQQTAMSEIEPLFNEISEAGLGQDIQNFFDSWQDLSLRPEGVPERQAVLTRAQMLVDSFQQTDMSLRNIQSIANSSLVTITGEISDSLKQIALLNDQIRTSELTTGASSNELRDQRELLLRGLSEKVGIAYFEENDGTVSVNLSNGQQLVSGSSYGKMYTYPTNGLNDIWVTTVGNPPPSPSHSSPPDRLITTLVNGQVGSQGELGGTLLTRDVIVPKVLSSINELANSISREVNLLHRSGYGLPDPQNGNVASTGLPFFTENQLVKTGDTSIVGSAVISGLDTSSIWIGMTVSGAGIPAGAVVTAIPSSVPASAKGSVEIYPPLAAGGAAGTAVTFTGVTTSTFSVAINKTVDIAASDADTVINGTGNNRNAVAIAELLNDTGTSFSIGTTSIADFYATLVSTVGLQTQSINSSVSQGEAYNLQLNTLWESKSAVSLDEELTNLIKYQKAFEGSAKMITTAADMMDVVLNMVR